MYRFGLSWVAVCRLFKMANESNYNEVSTSVFKSLFFQCKDEEKLRLRELYPDLINNLQKEMKENEFYKNHIIKD